MRGESFINVCTSPSLKTLSIMSNVVNNISESVEFEGLKPEFVELGGISTNVKQFAKGNVNDSSVVVHGIKKG